MDKGRVYTGRGGGGTILGFPFFSFFFAGDGSFIFGQWGKIDAREKGGFLAANTSTVALVSIFTNEKSNIHSTSGPRTEFFDPSTRNAVRAARRTLGQQNRTSGKRGRQEGGGGG